MSDQKMSPEEETVQRALGTLDKFEVQVKRRTTRESFARVLVTAGGKKEAEERALQMIKKEEEDDTGQKISWSDNQAGESRKPTVDDVRKLEEDDYLIHRFDRKKGDEEEKIDGAILGKIM